MYTLYHAKGACSLAIQAALELVNADYEVKNLDLSKGEHKTEAYLKINPFGKVPALTGDNMALSEGIAIHLFLFESLPESSLFPKNLHERADAYRWLAFVYSNIHPHFSRLFSPANYGENLDDIRSNAKTAIESLFQLVDKHLENKAFLAGTQLSAADLYLAVQVQWAEGFSMGISEHFPNLARSAQGVYNHPSVGHIYKNEFGIQ